MKTQRDITEITQDLALIVAKLEIVVKMQEERINNLNSEIKEMRLSVQKLVDDHEHRLKTLEATQSYTRGVIGLAVFLCGLFGGKISGFF